MEMNPGGRRHNSQKLGGAPTFPWIFLHFTLDFPGITQETETPIAKKCYFQKKERTNRLIGLSSLTVTLFRVEKRGGRDWPDWLYFTEGVERPGAPLIWIGFVQASLELAKRRKVHQVGLSTPLSCYSIIPVHWLTGLSSFPLRSLTKDSSGVKHPQEMENYRLFLLIELK